MQYGGRTRWDLRGEGGEVELGGEEGGWGEGRTLRGGAGMIDLGEKVDG